MRKRFLALPAQAIKHRPPGIDGEAVPLQQMVDVYKRQQHTGSVKASSPASSRM